VAAIDPLIDQIEDKVLRERLRSEVKKLTDEKSFGLVFEDHLPELTPLYAERVRKGSMVAIRGGDIADVWRVKSVVGKAAQCINRRTAEKRHIPIDNLVVVLQFGEPIFPSLTPVDRVKNGPDDSPSHILIEADNYHALQLLEYLYAGQVDCIYIDPPYNTGARDWKYNNNYVDVNDGWRHSKWLSFMKKRLTLAKRLLNPLTGVMIVTIDEHEVHHLRMLIQSVIPEATLQMVTIVNNAAGVSQGGFYRVEEYALFCFLGTAKPVPGDDDHLADAEKSLLTPYWFSLIRYGGINALPTKRANLVYPIAINPETLKIAGIGKTLKERADSGEVERVTDDWRPGVEQINGFDVIWPYRGNGNLSTWQLNSDTLLQLEQQGFVRIRPQKKGPGGNKFSISYVKEGNRKKVVEGVIPILGRETADGTLILGQIPRNVIPKTVWKRARHDAGKWGSRSLREVLGDVTFDYAKSPYAVMDCLSSVVGLNKEALIVDFFAGSGTTLLATLLLNNRDDGNRRCVLVTNNELSVEKELAMRAEGVDPTDPKWESAGVCRSVTWPRSNSIILGRDVNGNVLKTEQPTGKTEEVEKPRTFRQISLLRSTELNTTLRKKELLSLIGKEYLPQSLVTEGVPFIVSEKHSASILFDETYVDEWLAGLEDQSHITTFYAVIAKKNDFDKIKREISDLLGPAMFSQEISRSMGEGFPANLEYFRVDFLDKNNVALGRQFHELLPILWLRAGAVGPRPELPKRMDIPPMLVPAMNTFAVLADESHYHQFLPVIRGRTDLTHVFLITDSEDAFRDMAKEIAVPNVIQLYRDYLENLMINKGEQG
jgi:adenine-specific DNA-methyltransferase